VIFALETLTGTSGSGAALPAIVPAARTHIASARLGWAVAAIAAAALVAAIILPRPPTASGGMATFVAIGAPYQRFFNHAAPAISPDGTTVAFWAPNTDGRVHLWVRNLGNPQARALPETMISELELEGFQPAFSPDGRSLVAFMDGKLKRISLDGGSPQTLADAPNPRGATWGANDQIVYQPAVGGPLFIIAASGGTPRALPDARPADDRRAGARHPFFLPDGEHFLFCDLARIYVTSVAGGQPRLLLEAASRAEYASGHLLYVKDGSLMAQRFDPAAQQLTGNPQRVEKSRLRVTSSIDSPSRLREWSAGMTGRVAVFPSRTWCGSDRQDSALASPAITTRCLLRPTCRIATEQIDLQTNWYVADVVDVQRGVSNRISLNAIDRVNSLTPLMSRDGSHVWFSGAPGIFRADAGRESPVLVGVNQGVVWLLDVSADGKWLLYHGLGQGTAGDIWALPLSGDPTPVPWLQSPAHEVFARFSPDGRWVAFVQRETEGFAVYVDAFPARGHRQRVSPGGGQSAMWSADGRRLYYLDPGTPGFRMMEVQLAYTPEGLRVSPPVELFRAPAPNSTIDRVQFWPSPDGQRFLYIASQDEAMPRTINVVLDWPALVNAPAGAARRE
jgi:Tol biopolymer transport system component